MCFSFLFRCYPNKILIRWYFLFLTMSILVTIYIGEKSGETALTKLIVAGMSGDILNLWTHYPPTIWLGMINIIILYNILQSNNLIYLIPLLGYGQFDPNQPHYHMKQLGPFILPHLKHFVMRHSDQMFEVFLSSHPLFRLVFYLMFFKPPIFRCLWV